MSAIFTLQLNDFEDRVLLPSHQHIVLVDFWAEWCPPCLVIAPILEQLVNQHPGQVLLAKLEVDVDENMKLAGRFKVRGFPTIILFRHGEEKTRFSGAQTLSYLENFIAPWLEQ